MFLSVLLCILLTSMLKHVHKSYRRGSHKSRLFTILLLFTNYLLYVVCVGADQEKFIYDVPCHNNELKNFHNASYKNFCSMRAGENPVFSITRLPMVYRYWSFRRSLEYDPGRKCTKNIERNQRKHETVGF